MATAARLALPAWRNETCARTIKVVGLDLTDSDYELQVRLKPDTPGDALIDLTKQAEAGDEGIYLSEVETVDGAPVSTLALTVDTATMQGLPYAGEVGDNTALAYAMQIDGQTRLFGDFMVLASAFDSDSAPTDRPSGDGISNSAAPWASATLTVASQDVITVAIDGAEAVGALVAESAANRDEAKAWATSPDEPDPDNAPGEQSAKTYADQLQPFTSLFVAAPPEVGFAYRFIWGNREFFTLSSAQGLYPNRATLPAAQTKVDDDTNTLLVDRLINAPWGATFFVGAPELGTSLRMRWGNRELWRWDRNYGFAPQKLLVPESTSIADQPDVPLLDRLGGGGSAASDADHLVVAAPNASGKLQLTSTRLSDSATFLLTDGSASARSPSITHDGATALYWDDGTAAAAWVPIEGGDGGPVLPLPIIDCWGDSLTNGRGAEVPTSHSVTHGPFPAQLAALLGSAVEAVNNFGENNQISAEIAARQGGAPALLTLTGNEIPESGAVTVTAYSVDVLYFGGVSGALTLTGTVAGIHGTLSGSNSGARGTSTYTFTRSASGSALACSADTPFVPDDGVSSRPHIQLYAYGRNDGVSSDAVTTILSELAASVAYQSSYAPRYLVGAVLAQIGDDLSSFATANAAIEAVYGDRFIDLNAAPTTNEMSTIGFVPDSYGSYPNGNTDAGDIAAGYIPTGMRFGAFVTGDYLHLNDFGYALWALRLYRKIQSLGWFPSLPVL
jgi:lysophospholipase L1-like esterase